MDEFGRTADSIANEKGHPETAAAVTEWAATPGAAETVAATKAAKEDKEAASAAAAAAATAAVPASHTATLNETAEGDFIGGGESPLPMLSTRSDQNDNPLLIPRGARASTAPHAQPLKGNTDDAPQRPGSGGFERRRRTPSATRYVFLYSRPYTGADYVLCLVSIIVCVDVCYCLLCSVLIQAAATCCRSCRDRRAQREQSRWSIKQYSCAAPRLFWDSGSPGVLQPLP